MKKKPPQDPIGLTLDGSEFLITFDRSQEPEPDSGWFRYWDEGVLIYREVLWGTEVGDEYHKHYRGATLWVKPKPGLIHYRVGFECLATKTFQDHWEYLQGRREFPREIDEETQWEVWSHLGYQEMAQYLFDHEPEWSIKYERHLLEPVLVLTTNEGFRKFKKVLGVRQVGQGGVGC